MPCLAFRSFPTTIGFFIAGKCVSTATLYQKIGIITRPKKVGIQSLTGSAQYPWMHSPLLQHGRFFLEHLRPFLIQVWVEIDFKIKYSINPTIVEQELAKIDQFVNKFV